MIYFDNAATTCIGESARVAIMNAGLGNPSSPHGLGIQMERKLREASRVLSGIVGCMPEELVFTSGGTESNNLAILGTAGYLKRTGGHILTSTMEHPSVSEPLRHLASEGFQVTYAPIGNWPSLIRSDTVMAVFAQVNNETGDVNDVDNLASMVKRLNPKTIVHVDGVQGFAKFPVRLRNVDLYAFSGHKIHASPGVGGLVVKKGTRLAPLLYGGGQQSGIRPGTENTPSILGMAAAAQELWTEHEQALSSVWPVYEIISGLVHGLPDVYINRFSEKEAAFTGKPNGEPPFSVSSPISPYIVSLSFLGVKGETLAHMLSDRGIYVSVGAACRSRKKGRSPLYALGLNDARVESAVRFSFSRRNTCDEAVKVKDAVMECVNYLRGLSRR